MKIYGDYKNPAYPTSEIVYSRDVKNIERFKIEKQQAYNDEGISVELSSKSFEFNKIKRIISSVPEVREGIINDLADKIRNNNYVVPAEPLASRLLQEHLKDSLLLRR